MPNVVYTVAERVEMVRQHEQGLSYRSIVDHFAASYPDRPIPSKSSVHKIVQQFHLTGNCDPSLIKFTCPKKQLTEETKLNICLMVEEGKGKKTLSEIAQELHVSKSSVHKVVRSNESFKMKNRRKKRPLPTEEEEKIEETITDDKIEATITDDKNEATMIDSSPLHYSLWSYLKNRLDSEGRTKDLTDVWNRVNKVLEGLDQQTVSKINSALDTSPSDHNDDVLNLTCPKKSSGSS